jgi:GTPase
MFIDEVSIKVKGGHGGAGTVSFRHEKYEPRGGPDGGDGGHGADVILLADNNLKTLLDLRYKREYAAEAGARGMGKNMRGKDGEDLVIRVPVGTMVFNHTTRALLADLTEKNQKIIIAAGGMGGKGNTHFKTSTNRAPRMAQPGMDGEEKHLDLELKLIADVGLVGKPNAGKSTLLSRLSAARPKIAAYPFTTLEPQLGIVQFGNYQQFVMADIPGIIEGAHQGKGLGIEFLKHIERTKILVLMVDVTSDHLAKEFEILVNELRSYSPALAEKPIIYCLTKSDLLTRKRRFKKEYVPISAVTGNGLDRLLEAIKGKLA